MPTNYVYVVLLQPTPFHRSTVFSGPVDVTACLSLSASTPLLVDTMEITVTGVVTTTTSISQSTLSVPMGNFWLVCNLQLPCIEFNFDLNNWLIGYVSTRVYKRASAQMQVREHANCLGVGRTGEASSRLVCECVSARMRACTWLLMSACTSKCASCF